MAPGGGRQGRHRRISCGPRVGYRAALRPHSGAARQDLCPSGRFPLRRCRIRCRLLRDQPERGPQCRPSAAHPPGSVLGGHRTGRPRSGIVARQPDGRVLRPDVPRLHRGQSRRQPGLRAGRLQPRPGRPGRDGRYRVLVIADFHPPGVPGTAVRRLRACAGRRRDGDGHARDIRGFQPPAGPRSGRPVQGVFGRCRRHRMVGRRRRARA